MERFMADRMLGKLAKWLRILGYDTLYLRQGSQDDIVAGLKEGRILLTRNRRATPWRGRGQVVVVVANNPREQLREVVEKLRLAPEESLLFSRCLRCNRPLSPASRKDVRDEVPDYIWQTRHDFHRCEQCGRIYWSGSHSARMRQQLREILGWSPGG